MVTKRTQELMEKDSKYFMHPFAEVAREPHLIFEKGRGITLIDTDGKEYMDMCSLTHGASLGYGRRELIETAYEQMNKLSYIVPVGSISNLPAIEYAEKLAQFTPQNVNHFFFCNSGSEAVETALKMAKAYWYFRGKATKLKVICLMQGYHGTTDFVSGLMADPERRIALGPDAAGIVRMPNYNCYRCSLGLKYPDCDIKCARYLDKVIEQEGEERVAAFIGEPVQGYGGAITPPPEYWPLVREVCTKRHVLMIADEVITGFCRTGKNFAVEHWNVEPDMMVIGKGMTGMYFPVAGIGVSNEVYDTLASHFLALGFTASGHPVGMAVAKAALDILISERIAKHVIKMGNHVRERLEKEFLPLPNVGQVGGLGLLQAIEIVDDKETKRRFPLEIDVTGRVLRQCLEKGLLPRLYSTYRHDRLAISPPIIISKKELDKELDILYPIIAGLKDLKVR